MSVVTALLVTHTMVPAKCQGNTLQRLEIQTGDYSNAAQVDDYCGLSRTVLHQDKKLEDFTESLMAVTTVSEGFSSRSFSPRPDGSLLVRGYQLPRASSNGIISIKQIL